MSKRTKYIIYALSAYLVFKLIFSYTIISVPGRWIIYQGNAKIDFPLCIVNPVRAYLIENKINKYVEEHINAPIVGDPNNIYDSTSILKQENFKWWFHSRLGENLKYRISAIYDDKKVGAIYVLLIAKDNKGIRSVAVFDKKTSKIEFIDCGESIFHIPLSE